VLIPKSTTPFDAGITVACRKSCPVPRDVCLLLPCCLVGEPQQSRILYCVNAHPGEHSQDSISVFELEILRQTAPFFYFCVLLYARLLSLSSRTSHLAKPEASHYLVNVRSPTP